MISINLFDRIRQVADDSGFNSVEEFVNYVLEELLINAYGGKENKLIDDKEKETHLLQLIKNNPNVKAYYIALYNHYNANGDQLNAGDIKVKIINRFY